MAFGIHSIFGSTAARPALGIAPAVSFAQAWRRLRKRLTRSPQNDALAELDDRFLRDIGLIRERDIGVSCEATREVDKMFWPP